MEIQKNLTKELEAYRWFWIFLYCGLRVEIDTISLAYGVSFLGIAVQSDPVVGVTLHHYPLEKCVEDSQHALGPEDAHLSYLELAGHRQYLILEEGVDVIAEQVDRSIRYHIPIILLI